MKNKALLASIIFCAITIAFKLGVYFSGNQLSTIGKYSHFLSLFLFVPFCFAFLIWYRDFELGGFISGKDALRAALKFVGYSLLILSVFNFFFFEYALKEVLVNMIKAMPAEELIANLAKGGKNISIEEANKLKETDINGINAFKDTTVKLFGMILFGALASFSASVFLKR